MLDGLVSSVAAPEEDRMVLTGDLGDLGVLTPTLSGAGRLMFSHEALAFHDVAELRTESGRISGISGTTYESGGLPTVWRACNFKSGRFVRFFFRRDEAMLDGVRGCCNLRR